ncbi:hypothetical protein [Candidatus Contubernalis alkaliaceticus]|uniref:hypothetical protein n=1 Tax=Candidatus Contubernalis alkaliaceticus TaxID=338645 RepID=UPI001F4C1407|nr:hypothetical protein [Candidatus Contubernalis alkalaceticus]UNC91699.1 hypothetical protein HUE98_06090 [Candidatus Contubernalis alkalaceticus]
MEWTDWMEEFYLSLLKQGWTLTQIDEMDIFYYFKLLRRTEKKQKDDDLAKFDSLGLM